MNEVSEQPEGTRFYWLRLVVNLVVCTAILAAAAYIVILINATEPTAQKLNSMRKSAALVETIVAHRGTYRPKLIVLGTVQSAQRIQLSPLVSGQVLELAKDFEPGGMVRKGDLLVRIDPADFENALSISKSELAQAKASMEIEEARQRLAEKELKLLEGSIDETNRGLVRREPQIASMKAQVSAAEASVDRAELNLDRTYVYAPFDAQVMSRMVNVGSQVTVGGELGQLVGLDEYWVMAAVPMRNLRWLQFPEQQPLSRSESNPTESDYHSESIEEGSSKVTLRDPDAWGQEVARSAQVARLIGALDEQTRLARVLITVQDPLGLKSGEPPLILDTLIETEIECKPIEDVIRIDRELIRDDDTVWVMKNDKLEIRQAEIEFRDADYAYVRRGLEHGDEVVITTLATVAPGIGLRKVNSNDSNDASPDESSSKTE